MSYNNFYMPDPRIPGIPSADLNEDLRNSGAPALMTTRDSRLFAQNGPHNLADLALYDAVLNEFYPTPLLTPTTTLGPAPQLRADPAKAMEAVDSALREELRERLLAPAPTRQETEEEDPEPTSTPARKWHVGVPQRRVMGKRIAKVDQACSRCRSHKQKCDGKKPNCGRCGEKKTCVYVPTERQVQWAQMKTGKNPNRKPRSSEQPAPVESAPAENRDLTGSWRNILPRLEAPGAAFGGLMAGLNGRIQYPEEPYGGLDTRPNGYSQHPRESYGAFAGYDTRLNQFSQYPQESHGASRALDTRPNGFLQPPQESDSTYEGMATWSNEPLQSPQQPVFVSAGYLPQMSGPLPGFEEPAFDFGMSMARPNGILPYTGDPSMAPDGQTGYGPDIGFTFDEFPQPSPGDGSWPQYDRHEPP